MRRDVIIADHRDGGEWMDWGCRVDDGREKREKGKERTEGGIKRRFLPGGGESVWLLLCCFETVLVVDIFLTKAKVG